jgi:hypothetical protein
VKGAVRRGPSLLPVYSAGVAVGRLHVLCAGTRGFVPRYSCRERRLIMGGIGASPLAAPSRRRHRAQDASHPVNGAIETAITSSTRRAKTQSSSGRPSSLSFAKPVRGWARLQYDAVEPVHRQVAEALERRWNAALEQLETLETRLTALTTAPCGTRDAGCERRGRYLLR